MVLPPLVFPCSTLQGPCLSGENSSLFCSGEQKSFMTFAPGELWRQETSPRSQHRQWWRGSPLRWPRG
jgi:hypothetical protein